MAGPSMTRGEFWCGGSGANLNRTQREIGSPGHNAGALLFGERMTSVYPFHGESIDSLIRRFQRALDAGAVMGDLRRKRFYASRGELERLKRRRAARRR